MGGVSLQSRRRITGIFLGKARLLAGHCGCSLLHNDPATTIGLRESMNGKYRAVYELFMKVLSKSYAQTYGIEVVVLIGGERSDSTIPTKRSDVCNSLDIDSHQRRGGRFLFALPGGSAYGESKPTDSLRHHAKRRQNGERGRTR
jgi:hypothetical protein